MTKVQIGDREVYYDGWLKDNLDLALQMVRDDWDMVFVIDGNEGVGKSGLAQQIGLYFDPNLRLENICFSADEFMERVRKAKKYECIIMDEAFSSLNSRQAMSKVNISLCSMLSEIRQKNLFILICIPSFFDLDKYVALWRSRALIHAYTGKGMQRGFFSFYSTGKKKTLYISGKKLYNYDIRPDFRGRFTKPYMVDEKEYRAKKLKALSESPKIENQTAGIEQRNSLIRYLKKQKWLNSEIADGINKFSKRKLSPSAVSKIINRK